MFLEEGCVIFQRDGEESIKQLTTIHDLVCSQYYSQLLHIISSDESDFEKLSSLLSKFHVLLWERMHSVTWKDVPDVYCQLFGLTTALVIMLKLDHPDLHREDNPQSSLGMGCDAGSLLHLADLGILMGGKKYVFLLQQVIRRLKVLYSQAAPPIDNNLQPVASEAVATLKRIPDTKFPHLRTAIAKVPCMSLQDFYERYLLTDTPIVITDAMQDWPALQRWPRLEYLQAALRGRWVPVELGRSYLSADYSSSLMLGEDFVRRCLLAREQLGYLAQHALLEQLEELRGDVCTPDFCCLLRDDDEQHDEVSRNAWLGPCGTVSPLHHDCFHNLLAQVVGCKFIRLYAPSASRLLRPMEGKMRNNSQVDLLCEAEAEEPEASFWETVLLPGEMLFIPRHFWHFVSAPDGHQAAQRLQQLYPTTPSAAAAPPATFSFSVNFWWGRRIEQPH